MNKQAIMSALRELLRLIIVAVIGAVVAWLTQLQSGIDPTSIWALAIAALLKFIDRYTYKSKDVNVFKF